MTNKNLLKLIRLLQQKFPGRASFIKRNFNRKLLVVAVWMDGNVPYLKQTENMQLRISFEVEK